MLQALQLQGCSAPKAFGSVLSFCSWSRPSSLARMAAVGCLKLRSCPCNLDSRSQWHIKLPALPRVPPHRHTPPYPSRGPAMQSHAATALHTHRSRCGSKGSPVCTADWLGFILARGFTFLAAAAAARQLRPAPAHQRRGARRRPRPERTAPGAAETQCNWCTLNKAIGDAKPAGFTTSCDHCMLAGLLVTRRCGSRQSCTCQPSAGALASGRSWHGCCVCNMHKPEHRRHRQKHFNMSSNGDFGTLLTSDSSGGAAIAASSCRAPSGSGSSAAAPGPPGDPAAAAGLESPLPLPPLLPLPPA